MAGKFLTYNCLIHVKFIIIFAVADRREAPVTGLRAGCET